MFYQLFLWLCNCLIVCYVHCESGYAVPFILFFLARFKTVFDYQITHHYHILKGETEKHSFFQGLVSVFIIAYGGAIINSILHYTSPAFLMNTTSATITIGIYTLSRFLPIHVIIWTSNRFRFLSLFPSIILESVYMMSNIDKALQFSYHYRVNTSKSPGVDATSPFLATDGSGNIHPSALVSISSVSVPFAFLCGFFGVHGGSILNEAFSACSRWKLTTPSICIRPFTGIYRVAITMCMIYVVFIALFLPVDHFHKTHIKHADQLIPFIVNHHYLTSSSPTMTGDQGMSLAAGGSSGSCGSSSVNSCTQFQEHQPEDKRHDEILPPTFNIKFLFPDDEIASDMYDDDDMYHHTHRKNPSKHLHAADGHSSSSDDDDDDDDGNTSDDPRQSHPDHHHHSGSGLHHYHDPYKFQIHGVTPNPRALHPHRGYDTTTSHHYDLKSAPHDHGQANSYHPDEDSNEDYPTSSFLSSFLDIGEYSSSNGNISTPATSIRVTPLLPNNKVSVIPSHSNPQRRQTTILDRIPSSTHHPGSPRRMLTSNTQQMFNSQEDGMTIETDSDHLGFHLSSSRMATPVSTAAGPIRLRGSFRREKSPFCLQPSVEIPSLCHINAQILQSCSLQQNPSLKCTVAIVFAHLFGGHHCNGSSTSSSVLGIHPPFQDPLKGPQVHPVRDTPGEPDGADYALSPVSPPFRKQPSHQRRNMFNYRDHLTHKRQSVWLFNAFDRISYPVRFSSQYTATTMEGSRRHTSVIDATPKEESIDEWDTVPQYPLHYDNDPLIEGDDARKATSSSSPQSPSPDKPLSEVPIDLHPHPHTSVAVVTPVHAVGSPMISFVFRTLLTKADEAVFLHSRMAQLINTATPIVTHLKRHLVTWCDVLLSKANSILLRVHDYLSSFQNGQIHLLAKRIQQSVWESFYAVRRWLCIYLHTLELDETVPSWLVPWVDKVQEFLGIHHEMQSHTFTTFSDGLPSTVFKPLPESTPHHSDRKAPDVRVKPQQQPQPQQQQQQEQHAHGTDPSTATGGMHPNPTVTTSTLRTAELMRQMHRHFYHDHEFVCDRKIVVHSISSDTLLLVKWNDTYLFPVTLLLFRAWITLSFFLLHILYYITIHPTTFRHRLSNEIAALAAQEQHDSNADHPVDNTRTQTPSGNENNHNQST